jgi:hypothetical protein
MNQANSREITACAIVVLMLATVIAPRARQWLRDGGPARILHLFAETCNLVNDRNEVISLVSPRIGPGPFTIVLENDFTAGLDSHQAVSIDGAKQGLAVGPLVVDVAEAAVWQPKPEWTQLRDADVARWPSPAELPSGITFFLEETVEGIAGDDLSTCLTGVEGLAGRGDGLTPTGDDMLMGVLYGLWVWHPRQEWMRMILETAVPRTTTLSANFLRAAADGEAVRQWHDLVNGRPQAVAEIMAIGHSSGADAWAGFVYTGSALRSARRCAVGRRPSVHMPHQLW